MKYNCLTVDMLIFHYGSSSQGTQWSSAPGGPHYYLIWEVIWKRDLGKSHFLWDHIPNHCFDMTTWIPNRFLKCIILTGPSWWLCHPPTCLTTKKLRDILDAFWMLFLTYNPSASPIIQPPKCIYTLSVCFTTILLEGTIAVASLPKGS